ncbi:hypothetical protein GTQ99_22120, partial [Kineococcus sp. T13]|uniref:hypothetical protein n=1 Tax=Kineococcus vitellinus TaxID=2696565 RepID=UPI0014121E50
QAPLCRAALDLVAARAHGEHALFAAVLRELREDFGDLCAVGSLAVAHAALRLVCTTSGSTGAQVLARVVVNDVPAARDVAAEVLAVLARAGDDLGGACEAARLLGRGPRAEDAVVVLTDVALALLTRTAALAGVGVSAVCRHLREQVESSLAGDPAA